MVFGERLEAIHTRDRLSAGVPVSSRFGWRRRGSDDDEEVERRVRLYSEQVRRTGHVSFLARREASGGIETNAE